MEWKYVKLTKKENIEIVEQKLQYNFPNDFKECVLKNNYGTPENYIFYLLDGSEKVFGSLLSFNEEDEEYILTYNKHENEKLIKIAIDPFGNFIAYERSTNEIVYLNHETDEVSKVAKNWTVFVESLSKKPDNKN